MNDSGEPDEENEEFYESLDRILSSSCSSTSASDEDAADHHRRRHHHRRGHCVPRFPPPSALSYDVWIAEPASVEERRRTLLKQLGLAGDPALARHRAGAVLGGGEIGRSVSCDGLCRPSAGDVGCGVAQIGRSRSDGCVDPLSHLQGCAKPPVMSRSLPSREESDGEEFGDGDRRLRIRNLDDGREFVVREDGSWDRVREVGTGRQLTMEEFEMCVGRSPIVQELMRRQQAADSTSNSDGVSPVSGGGVGGAGLRSTGSARHKKRGSWLRSIKSVAGSVVAGGYHYHRDRRSSDEKDTSSEKGGRRSSSATDDSQDGPHHFPEKVKVRQYGKSHKELTALCLSQEIQAHSGSIWSIKFSLDGRFLASAGEDCVIHVWQVSEYERREELFLDRGMEENGNCNPFFAAITNGSPEPVLALACVEGSHWEKKRRAKVSGSRKSVGSDHTMVPEHVFALAEKPFCSFKGHRADVLDLSWSKSQYLLSSSMDKTVRLWHMSSISCLKTFSHSDYVTCIQFNPVDDRYFISGSLDEKVRIWSIPDRQIVDWNDLHEMVTAACYTPDGQGALVGSHKGSCHLYDTSENKLQQKSRIDLQNKKKRSSHKKITGFQFAPGSSSEVLITSADSRIRVVDGVELVHKYKGFRNTSSQISASVTSSGKHVICASEDSHVYVWRHDADSRPSKSKGVISVMQSYEHFHCQDVTVAVPWPGITMGGKLRTLSNRQADLDGVPMASLDIHSLSNGHEGISSYKYAECSQYNGAPNSNSSHFGDRVSATWPEEKLLVTSGRHSPQTNGNFCNEAVPVQSRSAWGLVIVTAGRGGEIKAFQNFGFPVRI
ncbi:putative transcription factor WD40-like family [Dioscorea sansibarensis]